MFNEILLSILDNHLLLPPAFNQTWYRTWNSILSCLFPVSKGFFIEPINRSVPSTFDHLTRQEIVFRVHRNRGKTYPVLVMKVLCNRMGEFYGKETLLYHVQAEANNALEAGLEPMYWIAAIGHQWCYGEKMEKDPKLKKIIDWQENIHSNGSIDHFKMLIEAIDNAERPTFIMGDLPSRAEMDERLNGHLEMQEREEIDGKDVNDSDWVTIPRQHDDN